MPQSQLSACNELVIIVLSRVCLASGRRLWDDTRSRLSKEATVTTPRYGWPGGSKKHSKQGRDRLARRANSGNKIGIKIWIGNSV
jgi:hypothetical protein